MHSCQVSERTQTYIINGQYFDEKALLKDNVFFVTIFAGNNHNTEK